MRTKARDIQSCKAADHGLISAAVVPESGIEKTGVVAKSGTAAKMARLALVALLSLVIAFALGGCRDTDVLTQKIIDAPGVSEIDYSLDPVRTDSPESDEQDVANLYEGESDDRNQDTQENQSDESDEQDQDTQQNQPEYQANEPTTDEAADKPSYERDAKSNGEATDGDIADGGAPDDKEGKASDSNSNEDAQGDASNEGNEGEHGNATEEGDGSESGAGNSGNPVEGENKQEPVEDEPESPKGATIVIDNPEATDDPQPEDDSPSPDQGQTGGNNENTWNPNPDDQGGGRDDGNKDTGETYADGTYDTIPSAGKVAAAGPYADIVQSLGGKGALAAAPQQWLDSLPAAAYANGSELANVHGIASWGSGSQMTNAAVQEIIDSGADCVLTSSTWNVMNQDQASAFNAAGVDVLVMPDIGVHNALDSDIAMCVDVVGELLKGAGTSIQFDAKAAAATWKSMHNLTLETCLAKNEGYTCASWGYDNIYVQNYIYQGNIDRAWGNRITNISPNSFQTAYVNGWDSNRGYGVGNPPNDAAGRSSFDLIDHYFQFSGLQEGSRVNSAQDSRFLEEDSILTSWYSPHLTSQRQPILNGNGHSTPVIIARDEQLAMQIVQAAADDGSPHNFGYDYEVFILPSGVSGSWNDGTFESYLIAPWAYSIAREHGTSQADQFVNDFYSTFFRCGAADCVEGYGGKVQVICSD